MSVNYKDTVRLPQTDFPMKAGLPKAEPPLLERWARIDLWARLRAQSKGREKFILHDGPPYANGNIHIGTALNKILKDIVNRSQQMLGRDANYVPGWDCHGLPIEWKIEERYRAEGRDKDQVPIVEFRRECREFADHWIGVQREEFKRLGVAGEWDRPYTTMSFPAEAQIVRELLKFLDGGGLYRGSKPVMWSVVEKTALAEAEIEYHDHVSPQIHVAFPVERPSVPELQGARIVIWTTTPWTIPANRAIAAAPTDRYLVMAVTSVADGVAARPGDRFVVAADLAAAFAAATGITGWDAAAELTGAAIVGTVCAHPLKAHPGAGGGYAFPVPVFQADFVTMDQGTGFVHIAPGHGADDYELGVRNGLEVPDTLGEDGVYLPHVPMFAGRAVLTSEGRDGDANRAVGEALAEAGALLARSRMEHSYPHSWRSKAPLIFRNTPQWFISMATNGLREKALAAIDATRWVPGGGRNRIRAMIENRPDWVISRQRAWGVPITLFVERASGRPLNDPQVNARIVEAVAAEGADAWFASPPERFLGEGRDPADYEQVFDILDVWFDSGSTHSFVLEDNPDLAWPASLYLEGSDQHRGWFHSSLLESCGTRGRAPYEAVLTHGFVLDEKRRKMSKSLGNSVAPQEVIDQYGADILRLWVASANYQDDMTIGPDILKAQTDAYRRLRNTLRYLLGNLSGFDPAERVEPARMPELERWVLHRVVEMDRQVRAACDAFDFHRMYVELHNFCAIDLSSLYFDIRKDTLYCDAPGDLRRRSARTVLDVLFDCLTAWLAPILCFTAEEAWLSRNPSETDSVHLRTFPAVDPAWADPALDAKWRRVREIRRVVTGALEIARAEKRIGASLQAAPVVHLPEADAALLADIDFADICITSGIALSAEAPPEGAFVLAEIPGVAVVVQPAEGEKCVRCWKVLPEVAPGGVCRRCAEVAGDLQAA